MPRVRRSLPVASVVPVALAAALLLACRGQEPRTEAIVAAAADPTEARLLIRYPSEGTLFPPDSVAPTFIWKDETPDVDRWYVVVRAEGSSDLLRTSVDLPRWRPSEEAWREIKQHSLERDVEVIVAGLSRARPSRVLSSARVDIRTSTDEVGDSLFYREVPLPFLKAVQDPSRIRWRFGAIDEPNGPPVVLKNLPVCGNCHSFSDNGTTLGLDVDYGNDKGAYAILPVSKHMVLDDPKIITWSDYKRSGGELTFGLLSRVSPTGRYVVSTVKDRSVFVAMPDIMFSQLFFPIKGILVVYDRQTKKFTALPGADDPKYVQTNAVWSPDGKDIVFARAEAYHAKRIEQQDAVLVDKKDVPEFTVEKKPFRYDLYRIPFNGGKGGTPEPLKGASSDGMSNYFPKYSPDGKWIVFCKSRSYMLLQPDSELYIIPAEGGVARRLRYNTARMNSWHSWSSNSRWLVFSSKVNGPYTQLFLTHIDENGNDSPPVLLERFTSPDRAANIPEFVKLRGDAIADIREQFLDPYSFLRAGLANENTGNHKGAERDYQRGLKLAPDDVELLNALGWTLFQDGRSAEAVTEYERALKADPRHVKTHNNLALALVDLGRLEEAADHYRKSLEIEPKAEIYSDLGFIMAGMGEAEAARADYEKALELDPNCSSAHVNLAVALVQKGRLAEAESHYRRALRARPTAQTYNGLGFVLARQGHTDQALAEFRKAIEVDPKFTPAFNNLAETLASEGRLDEAAHYYELSLVQSPNAAVYNALGGVLRRLGRMDEAADQFAKAKALASVR
jgi:Flp pilus assembly protein TadD